MSESKINQILHTQINWSDQSNSFSSLIESQSLNATQAIEASHYHFLQLNQLTERWSQCQEECFNIAESGFNEGLNFLLTCLLFEAFLLENPQKPLKKLFFSRFDKAPFKQEELQLTLQKMPELTHFITPLLAQAPLALPGCHRLHFKNVTLDLWLGDVQQLLPQLYHHQQGLFDCWFFNDCATDNSPDRCNGKLLRLIASTCKENATLTMLSNQKENVTQQLQATSFALSVQNEGNKQENIIIAKLASAKGSTPRYMNHFRAGKTTNSKEIAIIGGGISSACLSLALVNRGFNVTLYCKDKQLGCGASGNQQGALYPLLNQQHNALSQLFANSFLYAKNYVEQVNQSHSFDFDLSGLLQLYYDPIAAKKLDKILQAQLPEALVHHSSAKQTDEISQLDIGQQALFYPAAGWLSPTQMVNAIFEKAKATGLLTIKLNHHLTHFEQQNEQWLCHFTNTTAKHDLLALTTAMNTLNFKQCEALPLSAARGQVTHIASNTQLQKLSVTLCHEGYLTPINNGFHCMGATFQRHDLNEAFSQQEQQHNKDKLAKCIKDKNWVEQITCEHQHAHVGIRCTTRDHFPYMGALPDYSKTKALYQQADKKMPIENAPFHNNLFVLTGLGSRGLTTAPLLAETLASQINQEPLPLPNEILNKIQCNRQWVNYLKKAKTLNF